MSLITGKGGGGTKREGGGHVKFYPYKVWPLTPKIDTATWTFLGLVTCDMVMYFKKIVTWDMSIS